MLRPSPRVVLGDRVRGGGFLEPSFVVQRRRLVRVEVRERDAEEREELGAVLHEDARRDERERACHVTRERTSAREFGGFVGFPLLRRGNFRLGLRARRVERVVPCSLFRVVPRASLERGDLRLEFARFRRTLRLGQRG